MGRPKVTIIKTSGNLGRAVAVEDGITGLIVTGIAVSQQFALGDVLGPFYQLSDAEAKGITEAYDIANKSLAWHHIKDFFFAGGNGIELYVMVVVNTTIMKDMADKTKTMMPVLLDGAKGRICLMGITRVPDAGYTAAHTSGLDDDVFDAVAKAQESAVDAFDKYWPIQVLVEGRLYEGVAGDAKNMRDASTGCNANRVSVVISQDHDTAALDARFAKYANVGFALGRLASIGVQRNMGRVKDGPMAIDNPALSNNALMKTFTTADLDALYDKGYIFLDKEDGKAGFYFVDDSCACPIDDDYAFINRGRTIDKAVRLIRTTYVNELKDDIDIDPATGRIGAEVIKSYQASCLKTLQINMQARGEISGKSVNIDANQNVLATDKVEVVVGIVPKGMVREIQVTLGFLNPANS
jgi:hypothetical protein